MNRREIVYREVGCEYMDGRRSFTQLGLSESLGISLSAINAAVSSLKEINAVRVKQRSFEVIALDRLLLYWATHRSLRKDIIYQTRADLPVTEIERSMPDEVAFTGYSAYRFLFNDAPADYSEVYVYATDEGVGDIKERFGRNDRIPNITVLRCDSALASAIKRHSLKHSSVCAAQLFVDLWNMGEWYAKDYIDALSKRLDI